MRVFVLRPCMINVAVWFIEVITIAWLTHKHTHKQAIYINT